MTHLGRRWNRTLVASLLTVTLLSAGCGSDDQKGAGPATTDSSSATAASSGVGTSVAANTRRVGIFVDNAFGDRAFFDIALKAVKPLEASGFTVTTYEGKLEADAFPAILQKAADDNDIIFVLGFEAIDAMLEVAGRAPSAQFVFIDGEIESPNMYSVAYRDEEGCFLVGALAARLTTSSALVGTNPDRVIGFVGGVDAPVIRKCETGYIAGAHEADPDVKVESRFVGSFGDPTLGREVNLNLMSAGSDLNYQYAGLSGEGGFDAATTEPGLYALGAGFDQSFLAPGRVPASMLKNVDATIVNTVEEFAAGTLQRGSSTTSGLSDGGLALVYDSGLVATELQDYVNDLGTRLASGALTISAG